MIAEQAERAKFMRQMGWDATLADERLMLLKDSHKLYLSALRHLLGEDFDDGQATADDTDPPRPFA